jgi:hypothetical protein
MTFSNRSSRPGASTTAAPSPHRYSQHSPQVYLVTLGAGRSRPLVGKKLPVRSPRKTTSRPLLRRLEHLEQLPLKHKRELFGIIDTYLERHRLAQRASG